jgi:hypothetical protein
VGTCCIEDPQFVEDGESILPESDAVAAGTPFGSLLDDRGLAALTDQVVGECESGEATANDQDVRFRRHGHSSFLESHKAIPGFGWPLIVLIETG